jgi:hypothetical protein
MKIAARIALALAVAAAAVPSASALPVGPIVHREFSLLPYLEQDNLFALSVVRKRSGALVLLDSTPGTAVRATPLGFSFPSGTTWGSYTSSADRHAYGAFSRSGAIQVVDLGDLSRPGPLAPVLFDAIRPGAGFDPASTRMGIIAILIGFQAAQVPAVFYVQGGQTVVLALDGTAFRPVGFLPEEGIFYFL